MEKLYYTIAPVTFVAGSFLTGTVPCQDKSNDYYTFYSICNNFTFSKEKAASLPLHHISEKYLSPIRMRFLCHCHGAAGGW